MRVSIAVISIALCSFTAIPLMGQTAQLYGAVRDPSQGVVGTAELTLTNEATQISRTTKSNKDGQYSFPFLQPGHYSALVQAPGFQSQSKQGIELQVDQQARWDIQLQVGAVQQTVNVESGPSLINSTDGSVSTVIDRTFVENLPLNGRSFQSLFELTPGAVIAKSTVNNTGQFNIDGQRSTSNYMTIDGVSANIAISSQANGVQAPAGVLPATSVLGGTNNLVSVDALQEFRLQTSSFAPEFGRAPGGQIQIVTRSGTNQFHGTLFEYFRNDKLDANNWFNNQNRLPKSVERQNDFGGVFGGPIWKDRTFFFLSYEGLRLIQPTTVTAIDVPNAAARAASPAALQPFLNAFALPNGPDLGNGFSILNASVSNPSNLDAGSVRIDHRLSDKWTVFGRYNEAPSAVDMRVPQNVAEILANASRTRTITGAVTGILSPTITLDTRLNWSGIVGSSVAELTSFGGATPPPASLLYPVNGNPNQSLILFETASSYYTAGKNAETSQKQWNFTSTLAQIHGKHSFKYGVDLRWLDPMLASEPAVVAAIFSSGIGLGAATPPPGSVLSGIATIGEVENNGPGFPMHIANYSFFAQDNWQINSHLTVTYGLRWDINPPLSAGGGHLLALTGVESPSTVAPAAPGTPLWKTSYTNFAPRVGIAYALSRNPGHETVIRAGFGVFHDIIDGGLTAQQSLSAPNSSIQVAFSVRFPLANITLPPLPATPPYALDGVDPNIQTPLIYQYNFGVERALGPRVKASATYVGSSANHLAREETLVGPNPLFSNINLDRSDANSSYNALQLQLQGRLARGLQILGSYTWSHSIDDASADSVVSVPFSTYLPPSIDRGPSDFDIRHSGTVALSYDIPKPPGSWFVQTLFGGWGTDLTFRMRSADPINIAYMRNLGYGGLVYRPDLVSGVPLYLSNPNVAGGSQINPAAFHVPTAAVPGNLGRNTLRGFDLAQADLAIRRNLVLNERVKLQFRAEFFNITNHPNFADPSGSLGSATATGAIIVPSAFGISTSMQSAGLGGLSPIYQIGGPRSIQLALKVLF